MDEARLREEIRAQLEAEHFAKQHQESERQRMNAAMNPMLQSARRMENSTATREDYGGRPGDVARDYGAVLAMQMLSGQTGTGLTDDGLPGVGEAA